MSNTGRLNQGDTLTYDIGTGVQEFEIAAGSTAENIVEIVNAVAGNNMSVSQAQNWLDNQFVDCSKSSLSDCQDCKTCDEPLQANEYYNEFDISPNPRNSSAFLSINGVDECWEYVIS